MRTIVSKMLSSVSIVLLMACSQQATPVSAADATPREAATRPDWIAALITQYESERVANPQREIFRYKFEDKTVYYVPPICCDIPSQLFSEDGKLMCYPDGGFTGRGDDRCPTFHKLKREEQLVWKDGRERARIKKPR